MLQSHNLVFSDFDSEWYKRWANELKQTPKGKGKYALHSNKFWQNAIMAQALHERGVVKEGARAIGFGVGKERLPALFASYGVKVTATDQDFSKEKAKEWDNDQLAHGAFSLNEDGICSQKDFTNNVSFEAADMTKIPKKFHAKYDFVWSNCALGHLGSIPAGLGFIKNSLDCLKPGGWAVHTTELNVISDKRTVKDGSTVVFRLRDVYNLAKRLTSAGYVCAPYHYLHGDQKEDHRITLRPEWGNDYSKLLIGGHIATQMLLIVHKPVTKMSKKTMLLEQAKHYKAYRQNLKKHKQYLLNNTTLKLLGSGADAKHGNFTITPVRKEVSIQGSKHGNVVLEYSNKSKHPLTGVYESLYNVKPIVLGTDDPINHESPIATDSWFMPNRPTVHLVRKEAGRWVAADYIKPGEKFGFSVDYKINKEAKAQGKETFVVVQERGGVISDSKVNLTF